MRHTHYIRGIILSLAFINGCASFVHADSCFLTLNCLRSLLSFSTTHKAQPTTAWILPSPQLHYHDACFLMAHNAFASTGHGYLYAQQRLTLSEQLTFGVRGFMLDLYCDNAGGVFLAHGGLTVDAYLRPLAAARGQGPMNLKEGLTDILTFLEKYPQEIITLVLEDHVQPQRGYVALDAALRETGAQHYALTPSDWNPNNHTYEDRWPTLGWMQRHNKRLVIFSDAGATDLAFHLWSHCTETQYGTVDVEKACKERKESSQYKNHIRALSLVNLFPTLPLPSLPEKLSFENVGASMSNLGEMLDDNIDSDEINGTMLPLLLTHLERNGVAEKPSFISLDFVDRGDPLSKVVAINKERVQKLLQKARSDQ